MVFQNVDVNYLAIFVAAIVSMVIGSLWYGPLFGRIWIALMGFTDKDMKKAKKKGMGKLYFAAFIGALVIAYVLAHFVVLLTASNIFAGMQIGFWLWLGFIAPVLLGIVLWEGKSVKLYLLNVFYWLVNLVVMGAILAVWR